MVGSLHPCLENGRSLFGPDTLYNTSNALHMHFFIMMHCVCLSNTGYVVSDQGAIGELLHD